MNLDHKRIILSKTNRIGDVIMGLSVAGILKQVYPNCHIIMLVTQYTADIAKQYLYADEVVAWDDPAIQANPVSALKALRADLIIHLRGQKNIAKAAKQAGISLRVGAISRLYHLLYCNKLQFISRNKQSLLHDSQLDMQHVLPFIHKPMPTKAEITNLLQFRESTTHCAALSLLDKNRFNVIIHPKSVTDAHQREWPLAYFAEVIAALNPEHFRVFITGTEADGQQVSALLCKPFSQVIDLTGQLSLAELQRFIWNADGLVAGSTGPLHMAAAFGIHALGLFTHTPGHQPNRWQPLGKKAEYLVSGSDQNHRIDDITPAQVLKRMIDWQTKKAL